MRPVPAPISSRGARAGSGQDGHTKGRPRLRMLLPDEKTCLFFALIGYVAGSVLFCDLLLRTFRHTDVFRASEDGNPGTHNAFACGGFWCGVCTLLADLTKGFLPVFLCLRQIEGLVPLFALTLLSPVLGHAFSLFHHGRGGKAIAASFGVLLGLLPRRRLPLLLLAACYLFFSLAAVIRPHDLRSIATYLVFAVLCLALVPEAPVRAGCCLVSGVVVCKHLLPILKRQVNRNENENTDPIL